MSTKSSGRRRCPDSDEEFLHRRHPIAPDVAMNFFLGTSRLSGPHTKPRAVPLVSCPRAACFFIRGHGGGNLLPCPLSISGCSIWLFDGLDGSATRARFYIRKGVESITQLPANFSQADSEKFKAAASG
jgi:hypothetical protein